MKQTTCCVIALSLLCVAILVKGYPMPSMFRVRRTEYKSEDAVIEYRRLLLRAYCFRCFEWPYYCGRLSALCHMPLPVSGKFQTSH
ncbi:hypothetical protein LSAT2_018211 [Lamellibrachia satsuma]|nr:hypothetical protein LSAT2_018211 [Lamellibrachia satsuma]